MRQIAIVFLVVGFLCLAVFVHFLLAFLRPGMYPPKRVLQERLKLFATVASGALLIGFLIYLIS
ncbi:hypothetical protein EJF36_05310 [Bacillus sp. HMF5848]|uniref:hypothetical protein n=1 Tax=Bacillus sp. HMF5848 TaxID=2495421 RepID=UPI000F7B43CE|nr:hypothetical protein [Bacillus sp. HMF5848]RSK26324.1 hypothetical protein EJF36_05310 [Bacillus sp. HMF5848]